MSERKPFAVKCTGCGHLWALFYTPLELGRAANLMKGAKCPSCEGGPKGIAIATEDDINAHPSLFSGTNEERTSD